MVKFAKNGSNVTTAAAKIARSFTGKKYICVPKQQPFFSFDDWFIGTTPLTRGIPHSHMETTLVFEYGNISSLENLFDQYPGQIAGVLLEPATTILPCNSVCTNALSFEKTCQGCTSGPNFLQKVQALCRSKGALFILDEMITGFRFNIKGAQTFFGVDPDLTTFGKAMANGFSVSALVGKREIMEVGAIKEEGAERTFLLSTTHGGEMSSLRAFISTMQVYKSENVCSHLWSYGSRLKAALLEAAKEKGVSDYFSLDGASVLMNYVTRNNTGEVALDFRTLFNQEMIKNGVLMPWISISLTHGESELDQTYSAARNTFDIYAKALESGIGKYLEGPTVKPVFRKFN
jgi:glutamate-1-semialdehyde 2,1-aminomutase